MTQTVAANGFLGIELPEDSLEKTFTYVTVGALTFPETISCTYKGRTAAQPLVQVNGVVYLMTFENNGSQITNDPQWIPQES